MLTHIDLFSGIGGFALACQWAGIETKVFCEIDPFCQKVLKKHWPDVPIIPDVRDFDGTKWTGATLITGGPPCQATSIAAAIQGKRTGATLYPEMGRVISLVKPEWVIVEQPASNKNWENKVKAHLESIGYLVARCERQASSCGAPHSRRRVFIIANASSQRLYEVARIGRTLPAIKEPWPSPPRGAWRATRTGNCRVDYGVSDWVDRLRSLGNAVVPQVAFEIIKAIVDAESGGE